MLGWTLTVGGEEPIENPLEDDLRKAARALNYEDVLEVTLAAAGKHMKVQSIFAEDVTLFDIEVFVDGDALVSRDIEGTNTVFAFLQSFFHDDGRWREMSPWKQGRLGQADGTGGFSPLPPLIGAGLGVALIHFVLSPQDLWSSIQLGMAGGGIGGAIGSFISWQLRKMD